MKTAIAVRHVAFEDTGSLEGVLRRQGYELRLFDAPAGDFAALERADPPLLIVLGGPIGVYEEAAYPFLGREIAVVERRLAAGKPVLGLCLGAQIMARALGARVYPGPVKEIGWGPLTLTDAGKASCLRHLGTEPVLHWHGDTFDLPEGATRLASTAAYENQAFVRGKSLALQFHPEVTETGMEGWFVGHAVELAANGLSVADLRAETARRAGPLVRRAQDCFSQWLEGL